jgi:hypothetical protein
VNWYQHALGQASAGDGVFSVPLTADAPDGVITVTLSSTVIVGSHERTIEEERQLVHIHSDGDGGRSLVGRRAAHSPGWIYLHWQRMLGGDAAIWGSLRYRTVPPKTTLRRCVAATITNHSRPH